MKNSKALKTISLLLFLYTVYYWLRSSLMPYYTGGLDGFAALAEMPSKMLHLLLLVITGIAVLFLFRKNFVLLFIGLSVICTIAGINAYNSYLSTIFSIKEIAEVMEEHYSRFPATSKINSVFICSLISSLISICLVYYYFIKDKHYLEKLIKKIAAYKRWYRIQLKK